MFTSEDFIRLFNQYHQGQCYAKRVFDDPFYHSALILSDKEIATLAHDDPTTKLFFKGDASERKFLRDGGQDTCDSLINRTCISIEFLRF